MTRINSGIPVEELHDKHLMAEHREIKRIPNCINKGRYSVKGQPDTFTLGTGHVKFFYDKLGYLYKRYVKLYDECIKRGFNVTDYSIHVYETHDFKWYEKFQHWLIHQQNSKLINKINL